MRHDESNVFLYANLFEEAAEYDSDAYPEDVRYEYVALEELTTRFRISFNYQLEQMPDNAQRDVILEIIHKHKDYLTSLEAALADAKDQTA